MPTHSMITQVHTRTDDGLPCVVETCPICSMVKLPDPLDGLARCVGCGSLGSAQVHLGYQTLQFLQSRIAAWQDRTFPNQPLAGKLAHLVREAAELRDKPSDLQEWADVLILLLGAAAKNGLTVRDLLAAAEAKFAIAQTRQWGPADSEGVHHHIG